MANNKGKPIVERWREDKNPVGIVKGAKKGKKIPISTKRSK